MGRMGRVGDSSRKTHRQVGHCGRRTQNKFIIIVKYQKKEEKQRRTHLHVGHCGRRQRHDGHVGDAPSELPELAVVRPEVMPPLTDAVRLEESEVPRKNDPLVYGKKHARGGAVGSHMGQVGLIRSDEV